MSTYHCPVCGYAELKEPPYDDLGYPSYEVCSCCGFETGFDDGGMTGDREARFLAYRDKWLARGAPWFSEVDVEPKSWSLCEQLGSIGINTDDLSAGK